MSTFVKYGSFTLSGAKNGNDLGGYPTPQISMSMEFDRDSTGKVLGARNIINIEGQMYSASGSGGFEKLGGFESGLRAAFSVDGRMFSFGCAGTTLYSGNAKVSRYTADKSEDYWTSTINYSIDLEVEVSGSGFDYVSSVQDEWNIEPLEEFSYIPSPFPAATVTQGNNSDPIPSAPFTFVAGPIYPAYRVSRTVGAVGKFVPTGSGGSGIDGLVNAQRWVAKQIGSGLKVQGATSGLVLYNFVRSISASQSEGSYRVTDTFLGLPTGVSGYTESFTIESSLDNTYLRTITINGTIKGLEPVNTGGVDSSGAIGSGLSGIFYPTVPSGRGTGNKFANAVSGYSGVKNSLYDRCKAFMSPTGSTVNTGAIFGRFFGRNESPLHPIPIQITEGFNPAEGSVTYSWAYNNRPLNLVSGSISETLTVNDNFPSQQIAEIFVIGRRLGPIIQDLGTYTSASRDVTFEVLFLRPTGLSGLRFPKTAYQAITGIVESFNPTYLLGPTPINSNCKAFVKSNTENWSVSEGRFVKTKSWAWTKCDSIAGANPNVQ
jgi:hypothetical protein